jgi:hypothetical protein
MVVLLFRALVAALVDRRSADRTLIFGDVSTGGAAPDYPWSLLASELIRVPKRLKLSGLFPRVYRQHVLSNAPVDVLHIAVPA